MRHRRAEVLVVKVSEDVTGEVKENMISLEATSPVVNKTVLGI
jgi:hypothetical protein